MKYTRNCFMAVFLLRFYSYSNIRLPMNIYIFYGIIYSVYLLRVCCQVNNNNETFSKLLKWPLTVISNAPVKSFI